MLPAFTLGGWFPTPTREGRPRMSTIPPTQTFADPLMVRRAAVLGAGTMGSRIAAHLANAGIPVILLDLPPKSEGERPLANAALDALSKSKPAAYYDQSSASLITPGTFDNDLPKLAHCDWVIEAVAENLEIKTALLARVLPHLAPARAADHQHIRPACRPHRPGADRPPRPLFRRPFLQSSPLHAAP